GGSGVGPPHGMRGAEVCTGTVRHRTIQSRLGPGTAPGCRWYLGRSRMNYRIALISEHASPLATLGGVDSGGQNVYVGQVARVLAAQGHIVDIFTRRDSPHLPEIVEWEPGVRVI